MTATPHECGHRTPVCPYCLGVQLNLTVDGRTVCPRCHDLFNGPRSPCPGAAEPGRFCRSHQAWASARQVAATAWAVALAAEVDDFRGDDREPCLLVQDALGVRR